jgi:hypothetical protein
MRIRDPANPGSGEDINRIRDKHPGSATLHLLISIEEVDGQ